MIEPKSYDNPRLKDLIAILIEWVNDELHGERIIVQDVEEDLYDGQVQVAVRLDPRQYFFFNENLMDFGAIEELFIIYTLAGIINTKYPKSHRICASDDVNYIFQI